LGSSSGQCDLRIPLQPLGKTPTSHILACGNVLAASWATSPSGR
jgi:hypothetical protein